MKLVKFFESLGKESKLFAKGSKSAVNVSTSISNSLVDTEFSLMKKLMNNTDNYKVIEKGTNKEVVQFGKMEMSEFTKTMRANKIEKAFKDSIGKNLSADEIKSIKTDIQPSPPARISEVENLMDTANQRYLGKKLEKVDTVEKFDEIVKNNKEVDNWFKSNLNKESVGFLAKTVVIAGATITLGVLVEQHMKKMALCSRYEYNPNSGLVTICYISQFTCTTQNMENMCDSNKIKNEIDEDIFNDHCTNPEAGGCIHCNSEGNDPILSNINVAYRCKKPSFLHAFTDMLGNNVSKVLGEISNTTGKIITAILKKLMWPLIIVIIIFLVVSVLIDYAKKSPLFSWHTSSSVGMGGGGKGEGGGGGGGGGEKNEYRKSDNSSNKIVA